MKKFKIKTLNCKRIFRYILISLILCNMSAIMIRFINIFLGINTPSLDYYFLIANSFVIPLAIFIVLANKERIIKKPVKRKVANNKQKAHKKSTSRVSTSSSQKEYRRKVS